MDSSAKWRRMTTFPEMPARQQVSTARSHFHRNLSSLDTPEVSRFIRKCRGKDETARSNRRWKLSIRTHPHDARRKLKKAIVPLSSASFRRGSFDEDPAIFRRYLYELSRPLSANGRLFKVIRWRGNVLHTDTVHATSIIFCIDDRDRDVMKLVKKEKENEKKKERTERKTEEERGGHSQYKRKQIYCACRDYDKVHFKSCPKSYTRVTHTKVSSI